MKKNRLSPLFSNSTLNKENLSPLTLLSPLKINIISLGCSKNLVDSEHLIRQLEAAGYAVEHNPSNIDGEIVVVNTCGFIADAQEESINTILEMGEAKRQGKIRRLIVMGCLSERFLAELTQELPEVDHFYGKFNWKQMLADLGKSYRDDLASDRTLTTLPHYAYMKISEGCNRFCAFCAIPLITGRHKSVPMEQLLDETHNLVARGVKEFNVIAQDLSSYGLDLYSKMMLPELIDKMASISGVEWIRLHYAYPTPSSARSLILMQRTSLTLAPVSYISVKNTLSRYVTLSTGFMAAKSSAVACLLRPSTCLPCPLASFLISMASI